MKFRGLKKENDYLANQIINYINFAVLGYDPAYKKLSTDHKEMIKRIINEN